MSRCVVGPIVFSRKETGPTVMVFALWSSMRTIEFHCLGDRWAPARHPPNIHSAPSELADRPLVNGNKILIDILYAVSGIDASRSLMPFIVNGWNGRDAMQFSKFILTIIIIMETYFPLLLAWSHRTVRHSTKCTTFAFVIIFSVSGFLFDISIFVVVAIFAID